jgi:hypothetical protein
MRAKKGLNASERSRVTKDVRQSMKIPEKTYRKIKDELLDKYEIKGFQTLFDYLVVSGVVYLKSDVLSVVRSRAPEYAIRFKQERLSRLGKVQKQKKESISQVVCTMYDRDNLALNNFVMEERIKKFWIFEILFDEFAKENTILVEHVKKCKSLNITERKKQVSRLMNDEYITVLHPKDAEEILNILTEKYDNREFGGILQDQIAEVDRRRQQKEKEEEEIEEDFNDKLARLRGLRNFQVRELIDTVIDDDT